MKELWDSLLFFKLPAGIDLQSDQHRECTDEIQHLAKSVARPDK